MVFLQTSFTPIHQYKRGLKFHFQIYHTTILLWNQSFRLRLCNSIILSIIKRTLTIITLQQKNYRRLSKKVCKKHSHNCQSLETDKFDLPGSYVIQLKIVLISYFIAENTSAIIGLQGALKFNGGGNINHSIFWKNLCPEKDSGQPEGTLLEAINR